MLTTWKQSRTSLEYPPTASDHGGGESSRKKKQSRRSRNDEEAATSHAAPDAAFGAHFVHLLARTSILHQDRTDSAVGGKQHKRRKINNDGRSAITDTEPILCITSPHRVVFMDRGGESGTSSPGGNLIESKTRNYVARPGTSSRFSLRGGAVGRQKTAGATDGTFAGVYPPGAQYDTAADLIYAIRNGGADVAIWTAAPSSTLPGPDDYAVDGEGIGDVTNGKQLHAKKRKPHQQRDTVTSADALVSVRLRIPGGKNAATLTPFTIPTSSSKGMAPPAAVGAAGCCEDGSIWVAIRFRSNENWGTFQILIVERSSNDEMEANGARSDMKSTKRRKAAADVNDEHEKNGWRILDSCATGTMDNASVLLTIQSMMLSRDKAEVSFRTHQVRINNNDNEEQHASVHIERFAKQNILQLETSESDVAIKLYADSLLIVHRKKNGRWMFTSVNLSGSDGALIDSTRTFPLPLDQMECATVFSFGRVGKDIIAILIKCRGNCPEAFLMSLRVIDFRRKAELSSVSWVEGDVSMIDDTSSIKDSRMTKMLHDKPCRAMITNELDGSIALLTSSKGGSLVIVSSKVQLSSSTPQSAPMASTFVSLASALRLVATSLSPPGEARALTLMAGLNSNLSKISSGADVFPNQNVVYDATDIFVASELLVSSAKQLIKHAESSARNRLLTNGNSKKVSNASDETNAHSISWKQVYQDSCTLITKIKGEKHNHSKRMVNGIKRGVSTVKTLPVTTYDIPKGFVEMAFKETAAVLLSLHGATAPANNQSEFRGVSQEAACVLVDVLQTNHISARADYGLRSLHREHVFLSILRACPSVSLTDAGSKTVGKLHVLDAMLKHVLDVPESALVSILRLLIRNASVDDAVTYYATAPETSKRGIVLSNRYKAMSDTQEDERNHIGAKLLSEAVLDFTSKVVTYSSCNHSFLTKAMRDSINTSGEVETLLLTLSKLLRVGGTRELQEEVNDSSKQVNLSLGTIQWITALTDAHMGTILTITNNGGLVIDRIQRAVRSAMAQSEFASELRKILDHVITGGDSMNFEAKYVDHNSSPTDTAIMPYTVERLAF